MAPQGSQPIQEPRLRLLCDEFTCYTCVLDIREEEGEGDPKFLTVQVSKEIIGRLVKLINTEHSC